MVDFATSHIYRALPEEISLLTSKSLEEDEPWRYNSWNRATSTSSKGSQAGCQSVRELVETLGRLSAEAQGLHRPVTTTASLALSESRMYVLREARGGEERPKVLGFIRVGKKTLYLGDVKSGRQLCKYNDVLSVLDFFVHASTRRQGHGKRLFEYMLEMESCRPHELALDRPSNKFRSFMAKHYDLANPIYQANNFVIYAGFFNLHTSRKQKSRCAAERRDAERPTGLDQARPCGDSMGRTASMKAMKARETRPWDTQRDSQDHQTGWKHEQWPCKSLQNITGRQIVRDVPVQRRASESLPALGRAEGTACGRFSDSAGVAASAVLRPGHHSVSIAVGQLSTEGRSDTSTRDVQNPSRNPITSAGTQAGQLRSGISAARETPLLAPRPTPASQHTVNPVDRQGLQVQRDSQRSSHGSGHTSQHGDRTVNTTGATQGHKYFRRELSQLQYPSHQLTLAPPKFGRRGRKIKPLLRDVE